MYQGFRYSHCLFTKFFNMKSAFSVCMLDLGRVQKQEQHRLEEEEKEKIKKTRRNSGRRGRRRRSRGRKSHGTRSNKNKIKPNKQKRKTPKYLETFSANLCKTDEEEDVERRNGGGEGKGAAAITTALTRLTALDPHERREVTI